MDKNIFLRNQGFLTFYTLPYNYFNFSIKTLHLVEGLFEHSISKQDIIIF
jgi:hypothetical protein